MKITIIPMICLVCIILLGRQGVKLNYQTNTTYNMTTANTQEHSNRGSQGSTGLFTNTSSLLSAEELKRLGLTVIPYEGLGGSGTGASQSIVIVPGQ